MSGTSDMNETPDAAEAQRFQRVAISCVGGTGLVLVVTAAALSSTYDAFGVAAGAVLATLNLWAIGLLVRNLLSGESGQVGWALFGVAKLGILFGAVYLLVFLGAADILAVVVGYGALPLGIVLAQLGKRSVEDPR